jgi:hypothetical protein
MAHTFPELVFGGVLVAPFVTYLFAALIVVIVLRPILHFVGFPKMFSNAGLAQLSLYVTVLGLLMLLF